MMPAMEDFAELDMTNPNAVVVGLTPDYFTYISISTKHSGY